MTDFLTHARVHGAGAYHETSFHQSREIQRSYIYSLTTVKTYCTDRQLIYSRGLLKINTGSQFTS